MVWFPHWGFHYHWDFEENWNLSSVVPVRVKEVVAMDRDFAVMWASMLGVARAEAEAIDTPGRGRVSLQFAAR